MVGGIWRWVGGGRRGWRGDLGGSFAISYATISTILVTFAANPNQNRGATEALILVGI